jgi:DNA-binding NarL/FixJ family response regulator
MKQRIRLLLADDRPTSRRGLRAVLGTRQEIEIVGEASNGQQAVRLVEELQPDVVLMDVSMPVLDGLEATRLVRSRWPGVKVVILTMYGLRRDDALAAGASAFLVKGCPTEDIVEAISEDLPRTTPRVRKLRGQADEETGSPILQAAHTWCLP